MTTDFTITYDDIVKNMFTNPRNGKRYAAELIGTILEIDPEKLYNKLEYIHPEIKTNKNVVGSTTDVPFTTDKIIIDIEVNRSDGKSTRVKNETYLYQIYLNELKTDKDYDKLKPVIQINIDTYDYLKENRFMYCSMIMDIVSHKITSENIKVYHINLKKLSNMNYEEIKKSRLQTILYLMVNSDEELLKKLYKGDSIMKSVKEEAESFAKTIDWASLYFDEDEIYRKNLEEEKQAGIKEGIARELSKAVTEAISENTKKVTQEVTKQTQLEIAKTMIDMGTDIEYVSKVTKLSKEELDMLKNNKK